MPAKIYQRILQAGVLVSLGVILLLFSNLLFPYISSKQLSFNILMELLLPFWLVLVWKFPDFRPQRSLITWGLLAYLAAILISAFTGVDFNLSFWGDVERLLGFFHITHFLLFYLYLVTAFREKADWYILLGASVLLAVIEAIIVISGAAIGTIGNTAYVSGYMLFNLYFAVLLILKTPWRWQAPFYIGIILMLIAFFKADTSGAVLGLFASLLFLLFLFGFFAAAKRVRRGSITIFVIGILLLVALFSQYNQPWFRSNDFLKDLSVNKPSFQTRRLSWEGAARDFHLHPWLGTGFGNYAIIFDRQFDPTFFNYALTETYFDRAHNNLIDIASTTGIIGLLTYLSIFIFAVREWLRALRLSGGRIQAGSGGRRIISLLVLAALLLAYFIQNLAVFDSLATYMGLMIALAYLVFLAQQAKQEQTEENQEGEEKEASLSPLKEFILLGFSFMAVVFVVLAFNVRPWMMLTRVIAAYSEMAAGNASTSFLAYRQAFALNTPLDRDGRTILVNTIINNPTIFTYLPASNIDENIKYSVAMMEKNIKYNPADSLTQMQAAQLYDIASRYYSEQPSSFKNYSDKALAAAEQAVASSPRRVPTYFVLAQIQANRGDLAKAESALLTAQALLPSYPETPCQLANYYALKSDARFQENLDRCLDSQGNSVSPATLEKGLKYYQDNNKTDYLLRAYRLLAARGSEDPLLYVNLAKAELAGGNLEAALDAAVKAADIDPTLRPAVQAFLQSIQNTTTPTSTEQ